MSAFPPVPKGHAFLAFENRPSEGMHYLGGVAASPSRSKVRLLAKVQPLRRTRGAMHLHVCCVPCQNPTAAGMRALANSIVQSFHPARGQQSDALCDNNPSLILEPLGAVTAWRPESAPK